MPLIKSLQLSPLLQGMSWGSPRERGTGQGEPPYSLPTLDANTALPSQNCTNTPLQECGWSEPAIQQGGREVRGTARKNTKYLQKIFSQSTRQTLSLNKLHSCTHKDQDLQIKNCFCKTNPKTSNLLKKQNQSVLFPHAAALEALPEGRAAGMELPLLTLQAGRGEGTLLHLPIFPSSSAPSSPVSCSSLRNTILSTDQPQDLQQCPAMLSTTDAVKKSIWHPHKAKNYGKHQHPLQQCVSLWPPTPSPSEDGQ